MKTPQEVAIKLWIDCIGIGKATAIPVIAQALTAFAEDHTADVMAKNVTYGRDDGLEAAAKIVEGLTILDPIGAAVVIRALKSKP